MNLTNVFNRNTVFKNCDNLNWTLLIVKKKSKIEKQIESVEIVLNEKQFEKMIVPNIKLNFS